jgi:hypothetical protein
MQLDLLTNEALFIIGYISVVFISFLMIIITCIKISNTSIKKFISEYKKSCLDTTTND